MASRGKTDSECLSEEVRGMAEERQGAIRYSCARFFSLFISCDLGMNILYSGVQHCESTMKINLNKYIFFVNINKKEFMI